MQPATGGWGTPPPPGQVERRLGTSDEAAGPPEGGPILPCRPPGGGYAKPPEDNFVAWHDVRAVAHRTGRGMPWRNHFSTLRDRFNCLPENLNPSLMLSNNLVNFSSCDRRLQFDWVAVVHSNCWDRRKFWLAAAYHSPLENHSAK